MSQEMINGLKTSLESSNELLHEQLNQIFLLKADLRYFKKEVERLESELKAKCAELEDVKAYRQEDEIQGTS